MLVATARVSWAALAASSAPLAICSIERRSSSAAEAASVSPAASSSVAAAIRSSIFCCRLLNIPVGPGLRPRVEGDVGFDAVCGTRRREPPLPTPTSEVFIRDLGPLAARVLEAVAPPPSGAPVFEGGTPPTSLACRERALGRPVVAGLFRIGTYIRKFASGFGMKMGIFDR